VSDAPPQRRTRVLIVTLDLIGERMAGPAIRVWNMATVLARTTDVRVVSSLPIERDSSDFGLHFVPEAEDRVMAGHEAWADVIIVQGNSMRMYPSIAGTDKILVADLYDPFHLEQLEQNKHHPLGEWSDEISKAVSLINEQLRRADCVICASERQQTLWLGALSSVGRVNPLTYSADPDFERFVRVVPFGLPSTPAVQTRHAIKGVVDGIAPDDKVLIWGGGIYEWFDPVTLVEAVGLVAAEHPEIKLFFMSARHFNPDVPEMKVLGDTIETSDRLGLTGRHVFFNENWVDYEDRVNYLLDADAGVSTHPTHLETRFSFRTRTLDYLWTGLPIVSTDGDSFADLVREHELGIVVPPADPAALAAALVRVLYDQELRDRAAANAAVVRDRFVWENALAPLVDFCERPSRAADHPTAADVRRAGGASGSFDAILAMPRGMRRDLALLGHYLRRGGLTLVLRKVTARRDRLRRR
jgi:glycosyltransferase involved in cell wall biosynthesis